jgi:hypothetical protein
MTSPKSDGNELKRALDTIMAPGFGKSPSPKSEVCTAGLRFHVGQLVWRASFDCTNDSIECPDCGGTGRIRCLLHDDTLVSVECAGCRVGYDPPTGRVRTYRRTGQARATTISGYEVHESKVTWRTTDSYLVDDENLFATEQEAQTRAAILAAEHDEEELRRIARKEKDTRSWAWNAHYHRKCIKDAEKQIEYHTKKLNVASLKAKEDKAHAKATLSTTGGQP